MRTVRIELTRLAAATSEAAASTGISPRPLSARLARRPGEREQIVMLVRPIRVERMASAVGERRSIQLSYGRRGKWWLEQELNLRRPVFRTGALPAELSSQWMRGVAGRIRTGDYGVTIRRLSPLGDGHHWEVDVRQFMTGGSACPAIRGQTRHRARKGLAPPRGIEPLASR